MNQTHKRHAIPRSPSQASYGVPIVRLLENTDSAIWHHTVVYVALYGSHDTIITTKSAWWLLCPGTYMVPGHLQPPWWPRDTGQPLPWLSIRSVPLNTKLSQFSLPWMNQLQTHTMCSQANHFWSDQVKEDWLNSPQPQPISNTPIRMNRPQSARALFTSMPWTVQWPQCPLSKYVNQ